MQVCSVCQRCHDDTANSCYEGCLPALSFIRDGDPEMIDGYSLDACLEAGPHSELYRAHELASGCKCLVRLVSVSGTDRQRFVDDARVAASLYNPNLVDVYQVGELKGGDAFVISGDVDGRTLREFLNGSGVPNLLTSIEIVRQTAEALHALHLAGLAHGAVNPENIILANDRDDRLVVRLQNVDYGRILQRSIVSNRFALDGQLSALRYYAPEQCTGDETDARTDVYSLGVVFYELLAGVPPFDAPNAAGLIHKHRTEAPPHIAIKNYELRMLITHCVAESLQKQGRLRQSSANLFARQLRHIEQLSTHSSTPPPAGKVQAAVAYPAITMPTQPPVEKQRVAAKKVRFVDTVGVSIEEWENSRNLQSEKGLIEEKVGIETNAVEPLEVGQAVVGSASIAPNDTVATTAAEVLTVDTATDRPKRSRLRQSKKKLHAMAARMDAPPANSLLESVVEKAADSALVRAEELVVETKPVETIASSPVQVANPILPTEQVKVAKRKKRNSSRTAKAKPVEIADAVVDEKTLPAPAAPPAFHLNAGEGEVKKKETVGPATVRPTLAELMSPEAIEARMREAMPVQRAPRKIGLLLDDEILPVAEISQEPVVGNALEQGAVEIQVEGCKPVEAVVRAPAPVEPQSEETNPIEIEVERPEPVEIQVEPVRPVGIQIEEPQVIAVSTPVDLTPARAEAIESVTPVEYQEPIQVSVEPSVPLDSIEQPVVQIPPAVEPKVDPEPKASKPEPMITAVQPRARDTLVTPRRAPRIELKPVDADAPRKPAPTVDPVHRPAPVLRRKPRSETVRPKQKTTVVTAAQRDDEEITLVRPPRRIKIPVARPMRRQAARMITPTGFDFFPTILGATASAAPIVASVPSDGMFSTYYEPSDSFSLSNYRSPLMYGGGMVLLIGLLFLAGDVITSNIVSLGAAETVTSRTTTGAPASRSADTPADMTIKTKPQPNVEKRSVAPVGTKQPSAELPEKSEAKLIKTETKPGAKPAAVSSTAKTAKAVPPKTEKAEPGKAAVPAPKSGATRPRIVKE